MYVRTYTDNVTHRHTHSSVDYMCFLVAEVLVGDPCAPVDPFVIGECASICVCVVCGW